MSRVFKLLVMVTLLGCAVGCDDNSPNATPGPAAKTSATVRAQSPSPMRTPTPGIGVCEFVKYNGHWYHLMIKHRGTDAEIGQWIGELPSRQCGAMSRRSVKAYVHPGKATSKALTVVDNFAVLYYVRVKGIECSGRICTVISNPL